jgi:hypothetical protein
MDMSRTCRWETTAHAQVTTNIPNTKWVGDALQGTIATNIADLNLASNTTEIGITAGIANPQCTSDGAYRQITANLAELEITNLVEIGITTNLATDDHLGNFLDLAIATHLIETQCTTQTLDLQITPNAPQYRRANLLKRQIALNLLDLDTARILDLGIAMQRSTRLYGTLTRNLNIAMDFGQAQVASTFIQCQITMNLVQGNVASASDRQIAAVALDYDLEPEGNANRQIINIDDRKRAFK